MLSGYIGQKDRLGALAAAIESSRENGTRLPHMLFLGRSGLGKTHLARTVSREIQVPFVVMHAPSIAEKQEIADRIIEADGGILFIDEIHALDRKICEDMYTVIDDRILTVERPTMQRVIATAYFEQESQLPPTVVEPWLGGGLYRYWAEVPTKELTVTQTPVSVTIIGATTDESLLPTPFYNRLSQLKVHLREYTNLELGTIGILYADDMDIEMSSDAAIFLAQRSLTNPRRMKQLVDRAADYGPVTMENAERAIKSLGVDVLGLEHPHRDILRALLNSPDGLSRTSLGQKLALPPKNLDHYWTDLLRLDLVTIDTRHRLTEYGREHIETQAI